MSRARADRKIALLATLGALLLRVLGWTWRVRFINDHHVRSHRERGQPIMYVLWHGELLPLLWAHRHRNIAIMISEHRDGELIARVARSIGFQFVRGSSTRGAARALLGGCRAIEEGLDLAVTPDGPRGPAQSVAPGALVISQRTGAPMVPVSAFASRSWRLRSWDSFVIPKPFALVRVAYSEPIEVPAVSARDAVQSADALHDGIMRAGAIAAGG